MGTASRVLAGAALALTALAPATARAAEPTPSPSSTPTSEPTPSPDAKTCHYVVDADKPVPVRAGPGKTYEKRGELQPSDEPITTTCATKGRGADHWVQVRSGEFENLWVWRDWLKPYSE